MRRQWLVGVGVGLALILGAVFLVWGSTNGVLLPQGKAKRLLSAAKHARERGALSEAQVKLAELIHTHPTSPWTDDALLELGAVYEQQQQLLQAQDAYRLLPEQFPNSPLVGQASARLGQVNAALLFSPVVAEDDVTYVVKAGDTLQEIASRHHTTIELLKRANALTGDMIRPKQKLKVGGGDFSLVVDKSDNQLLVTRNNQFFKSYAAATGKDNSTPTGTFKIVNKIVNPVWYRQGAVVPPDSPENILGTRWLGLDKPGYGIHGSVEPTGIGQQITAGCVRLTNADVEELFAMLPVGASVTIVE